MSKQQSQRTGEGMWDDDVSDQVYFQYEDQMNWDPTQADDSAQVLTNLRNQSISVRTLNVLADEASRKRNIPVSSLIT